MDAVEQSIDECEAQLERRRNNHPSPRFPDDLPIARKRDEIAEAIRTHQVVIVCGETGSGKTTQLPKICLSLGRGIDGVIGHTQPRRIAARSLASRIAEEIGRPLGGTVGCKVRFGDDTGHDTAVKVMTDGILLAETQSDPDLLRYDTIIIDEAHERSLNIDFLLGYLKRLCPRRPDLKVIVTSATIDPERFAEHFASPDGTPAPVIEVSGRTFPVEVLYRPVADTEASTDEQQDAHIDGPDLYDAVAAAMDEVDHLDPTSRGDVLVFMSGEREIRETTDVLTKKYALEHHRGRNVEVLPLYARLSPAEQQRVFKPHGGRRIVVATNVAETSLTVPGIRFVIDPGTARISRYSTRSKTLRLPIEAVSRASVDQRKGRCGRVGPGTCIRLFSEADYDGRPEFTEPEIKRTNLASAILQMSALRLGDVERFPFIEPPDPRQIRDGFDTLFELGAIDDHRRLTSIGRALARFPVDPRIGRMLLEGHEQGCLEEVMVIAAGLSIQDPRERPHDKRDAADQAHAIFQHERSDFLTLLNIWTWYNDMRHELSRSQLRRACQKAYLNSVRMFEWRDIVHQLRERCRELGLETKSDPEDYAGIHRSLLAGLATSVGKKGDGFEYQGPRSNAFHLFPASGLFGLRPKWILAGELVRTTKLYARTVAVIEPSWVEDAAPALVTRSHAEPVWDHEKQRIEARERVSLYGLELINNRRVHFGPIDPDTSRELFIHHALVLGGLRTRAPFMRHNQRLMKEVKQLEDKARRTDLIASERARFAFFDRVLPPRIYSLATFDRWRKRAERDNPEILRMRREDLLVGEASAITPENFPDRLDVGPTQSPLRYRYDPGVAGDGMTAVVPLEALAQLRPENLDRLVPGMIREKVVELVRTLPKSFRRVIGPAPEFADEFVAAGVPDNRLLHVAIGEYVGATRGVAIPPNQFRPDLLPQHLKVNLRVVDDQGRELAAGRDLEQLRAELGDRVRSALSAVNDDRFNRGGFTDWDFDDLPDSITIDRQGMTIPAFPAIIDEGDAAAIRLAETADAARELTRYGVRRLLVGRVRREVRFQINNLPKLTALTIAHAPIGSTESLKRALADLAVELTVGDRLDGVRTRAAFVALADEGWDKLVPSCLHAGELTAQILGPYQELMAKLSERLSPAWAEVERDVYRQLEMLCPPGFLSKVRVERLRHYPRYLRAAAARFDKLRTGGLGRDQKAMHEIRPLWRRLNDHADRLRGLPEFETYRWMLEELRVSLFAQELGVPVRVSPQRLAEQWQRVVDRLHGVADLSDTTNQTSSSAEHAAKSRPE